MKTTNKSCNSCYYSNSYYYCNSCVMKGYVTQYRECKKCKETQQLLTELFEVLDWTEESNNGSSFHPTHISSCRIMHTEKLDKILPRLKELTK